MRIATLDFETFWSKTHSLTKMSPMAYVMHPETEIISLALKVKDGRTEVVFGEDKIAHFLSVVDWDTSMALGHNMSGFDALILSWRFGIRPKMWGCTMAMARPLHAKTTGLSLAKLSQHYGIGGKNNEALINTQGKHLRDFTPAELHAMAEYNGDDVELCYRLFHKMRPHYTPKELWHIDAKIRGLVEPKLHLDTDLLEDALRTERENKKATLLELGRMLDPTAMALMQTEEDVLEFVRSEMASAPKFAKFLESRGVPVPMKPSPSDPEKEVPALAKTDEAFIALQDDLDEVVATAARARLSVKSTIVETRLERFIEAAQHTGGRWPVTVHYCGADTTGRASGWHYNPLNLPRVTGKGKPSDALRRSVIAPPGHKVVVCDKSGIELRVNHFLWKVPSSMAMYREDPQADLYRAFAAQRYGIPMEAVDKSQRQLAKVAQLGLGFGAGWRTFQRVAKLMSGGTIDLSDDEAEAIVHDWRYAYSDIVQGWKKCHAALPVIESGQEEPIDAWGLLHTHPEGILLPSGRLIRYPLLREEEDKTTGRREWVYGEGRHKARIYAGKITENCVQALARDCVYDDAVKVFRETGYTYSLEVYDELVYVIPDSEAEDFLKVLTNIMSTPPDWWPELVLSAEGDIAQRYGDAK